MKLLVIIFIFLTAGLNGLAQSETVQADNYLFDQILITGKTNLNHFQMYYRDSSFTEIPGPTKNHLRISIPARKIQAESKMMKNDFLNMINAHDYPAIVIILDSDLTTGSTFNSGSLYRIGLMLNGKTNQYQVRLTSGDRFKDQWFISGRLKMNLSSFGIEPPQKFFGLVKIEDEVFINFKILFASTNQHAGNSLSFTKGEKDQ